MRVKDAEKLTFPVVIACFLGFFLLLVSPLQMADGQEDTTAQKEISRLLALGDKHFKNWHYTVPAGKENNALAVYQRVLQLDPHNALALQRMNAMEKYYLRKISQTPSGQSKKITQYYEKVLLINPNNEEARKALGISPLPTPTAVPTPTPKSTTKTWCKSEQEYEARQKEYDNELRKALKKARELYAQRNRKDLSIAKRAIAAFQEVIDKYNNYDAMWESARMHWWLGDHSPEQSKLKIFNQGIQLCKRATTLYPTRAEGYYWRAVLTGKWAETQGIFKSLQYVDDMVKSVKKVIEIDPLHPNAYAVLGVIYRDAPPWPVSIGDLQKSMESIQKSISLKPVNLFPRLELGILYNKLKKYDKAKETLQYVLDMPLQPDYIPEDTEYKERAKEILMMMKRRGL